MALFTLSKDKYLNILLVQNNPVKDRILHILSSPMLKIDHVGSIADVRKKVFNKGSIWHCWILDPNLDGEENGINLIREFNHFPFIIVLSGKGTMRLAFKAAHLGVMDVFDYNPENDFDELIESVIHTVILGFLMNSKRSDYLEVFLALKKTILTTVPDWARHAFISQRYLERICENHVGLPPRYVLPFYYHLFTKLYSTLTGYGESWFKKRFNSHESAFFLNCNKFIENRTSKTFLKRRNTMEVSCKAIS